MFLELFCVVKFCFIEIALEFEMLGLVWRNPVVKIPHWSGSFTLLSLPANIIHAWMIVVLRDVKLCTSWMSFNEDRPNIDNSWYISTIIQKTVGNSVKSLYFARHWKKFHLPVPWQWKIAKDVHLDHSRLTCKYKLI